ncbi:MAG: large conductance mechanosensitive channel protein MscL [Candidatus Doudnabacteria bacterium]|nr:large conductance mechanosensitive channel protein MscL [Candidatus Doudnabacteria bacterium]
MFKGFKDFVLRGNAVDLAVGVVMGAAFGTVVNALVKDFLTPLIGIIFRIPHLSGWSLTINGSTFLFADLINSFIAFLLVALAVYFFVVVPMNTLTTKFKKPVEPGTKKCPDCLSDIPLAAKRCAFCGQVIV